MAYSRFRRYPTRAAYASDPLRRAGLALVTRYLRLFRSEGWPPGLGGWGAERRAAERVLEDLGGLRDALHALIPATGTISRTILMRQSTHLAPRWARLMALEYGHLIAILRIISVRRPHLPAEW